MCSGAKDLYRKPMSKIARTLVSKQKRRYKQDGFDLDLTYITGVGDDGLDPPPGFQAVPKIIAMGIPSEGVEGQFRNPMSEVVRFFDTTHPDASKICNLCIEDTRQYDVEQFSGIVASYPFADHNCPPLMLLPAFCKGAEEWLKMSEDNVIAVHCKAGKSRTGVMICALLLHMGLYTDPAECITFYGDRRTRDGKGVTIPSQHRYICYYKVMIDCGLAAKKMIPQPRKMLLKRIRLVDVPNRFFATADGQGIQVAVMDHGGYNMAKGKWEGNIYESWSDSGRAGMKGSLYAPATGSTAERQVTCLTFVVEREIVEDIKLMFFEQSGDKKGKIFWLWFNTCFLPEPTQDSQEVTFVLGREQLDKFGMKKKFPKTFKVEITCMDLELDESGTRPPAQNAGEVNFRLTRDKQLVQCLKSFPMGSKAAAFAGIDPKKLLAPAGEEDEDEFDDGVDTSEWGKALELVPSQWKGACSRIKTNYLTYLQGKVPTMKLPNIEGVKDWGNFSVVGMVINSIEITPEQCDVEPTSGGLTIRVRGAAGSFDAFEWNAERTKMPKAKDTGHATAAFRDLAVDVVFDIAFEEDATLELGESDVQIKIGKMEMQVTDSGKPKIVVNKLVNYLIDDLTREVEAKMAEVFSDVEGLRERVSAVLEELSQCFAGIPAISSPRSTSQAAEPVAEAGPELSEALNSEVLEADHEPPPELELEPQLEPQPVPKSESLPQEPERESEGES
eukprot:SAG31_NODE_565_length_14056_cov_22.573189_2_plen_729_part_00